MVSLLSSSSCVSRVLSSNTRKAMILSSRRSYNNVVARPSSSRLLLRFRPATATPSASSLQSSLFSTEAVVPGVGKGKTSTGYVGLAVEPDWYNVIHEKFQALLDKMEASDMPETAQYRIDVTKWCNYVIATAKEHPDNPEAVEDAVGMGQVEELIEMAEDEMVALDTYLKTRMWELVAEANPAVDFDPDPTKDPMGEGGDPDVAENLRAGMEAMKEQKEEK